MNVEMEKELRNLFHFKGDDKFARLVLSQVANEANISCRRSLCTNFLFVDNSQRTSLQKQTKNRNRDVHVHNQKVFDRNSESVGKNESLSAHDAGSLLQQLLECRQQPGTNVPRLSDRRERCRRQRPEWAVRE